MFCSFKLDNDNKIKISAIHYFLRLLNIKENWQLLKGFKVRDQSHIYVYLILLILQIERLSLFYKHVWIYLFLMKDIHTLPTKFIEYIQGKKLNKKRHCHCLAKSINNIRCSKHFPFSCTPF